MNKFQVRFRPSARRELEALPDRVLQRVFSKIEALAAAPRPVGCKKLTNSDDLWRIRVGDYRVVYSIDHRAFAVDILRVRHRRDVYD